MIPSSTVSLAEVVSTLGLRQPTEEQAAVAEFAPFEDTTEGRLGRPLLVVAGAGSGKTETLSLRATYLAAHYGIPGHSILGLTFTRKAAAELSDRLRSRLQGWAAVSEGTDRSRGGGSRLVNPVGAYEHVPEATTYNSFALSVVQEFGARVGIEPNAAHLGEAAAWQQMSEIVAGWDSDLNATVGEESVVDRVLRLRDAIANQALTLEQARRRIRRLLDRFEAAKAEGTRSYLKSFHQAGEDTLRQQLQMLSIIEEFDRQKVECGTMDYADQVLAAIKVVEESAEARETLRRRHQIVFLDEFQDTSVAQMRLLSALFSDHPVTAVGDPNQAIYGWRGASAASLEEFHHRFSTSSAEHATLSLSTAWRNDRSILRAANVLAGPLSKPAAYLAGAAPGAPVALPELVARPGAGSGFVQAIFTASQNEAISSAVQFVSEQRRRLSRDGGERTEPRPGSVAVLSRTRAALHPMVSALREAGIPAQAVGGDSLLAHPAVRDLRATLEITNDVGGSDHLLRLLTDLDLGAADLRALGNHARRLAERRSSASQGQSQGAQHEPALLLDAVESCARGEEVKGLSQAGGQRVGRLGRRLALLRRRSGSSISEQIQDARYVMGLDAEAAADPTAEDVTSVLDVFADSASEYESSAERPTMGAFLRWLDAAELRERGLSAPQVNIDPDAVQVMTIHASKGLEWDAVALIDVASGRFPSGGRGCRTSRGEVSRPPSPSPSSGWIRDAGSLAYPLREDHHYLPDPPIWNMERSGSSLQGEFQEDVGAYLQDEERRLAYVATTRARHALLLAGSWFAVGKTPRYPSVFMAELFASDDPGTRWPDFLDGEEHATGGELDSRDSNQEDSEAPAITSGLIVALPPAGDWSELGGSGQRSQYPRDPGPLRRQIEQGAARVREEIEALSSSPSELKEGPDTVLAALENTSLARDVEVLLKDRQRRDEREAALSTPESALELVAQSRSLSVTELAAFRANPREAAEDLVRPVPSRPAASTQVGTAFHAWMESRLRRLSADGGDPDRAEDEAPAFPLVPDDKELLDRLVATASQIDFSGYSVAAVEVPFALTETGQIIRGRIDAVLRAHRGEEGSGGDYLLVDWKTTKGTKRNLSREESIRYGAQLDFYRRAWEPIAEDQGVQVRAQLVFISPDGWWVVTDRELETAEEHA